MITIVISNGDWAEAEDPEAARLAARTMMRDAAQYGSSTSRFLTASFYVDGKLVGTATHTL